MSRTTKPTLPIKQYLCAGNQPVVLPTADSNLDILNQIINWLSFKQFQPELKQDIRQGLCAGFTALWLYYTARHKQDYFFKLLNKIIAWDGHSVGSDASFTELLNYLFFLQAPENYYPELNQSNLVEKINFLAPPQHQVREPEFQFSFLFHLYELKNFLIRLLPKFTKKMIFIASGAHLVGLYVEDTKGPYQFYDPTRPRVVQRFHTVNEVVESLRQSLMPYNEDTYEPWLPLSFNVLDF